MKIARFGCGSQIWSREDDDDEKREVVDIGDVGVGAEKRGGLCVMRKENSMNLPVRTSFFMVVRGDEEEDRGGQARDVGIRG